MIDANQLGSAGYAAATQVQQSFGVVGTQSITFTSTPPRPRSRRRDLHGDGERGSKRQPGHLLGRPLGEREAAPRQGASVTLVAVGTCVIDANQGGNASYQAAPQIQQNFAVVGTPGHHFHLDPADPTLVGGSLHGDGERWREWQPGHLLGRPLGEWKLYRFGCHSHLRRRRNLRD